MRLVDFGRAGSYSWVDFDYRVGYKVGCCRKSEVDYYTIDFDCRNCHVVNPVDHSCFLADQLRPSRRK